MQIFTALEQVKIPKKISWQNSQVPSLSPTNSKDFDGEIPKCGYAGDGDRARP